MKENPSKDALTEWLIKTYMPSVYLFWHVDKDKEDKTNLIADIVGELKICWAEDVSVEDLIYCPAAFLFFWDKFEQKYDFKEHIVFQKLESEYACLINPFLANCVGKGQNRVEAFCRALYEFERRKDQKLKSKGSFALKKRT